jgi:hypothetical protein
MNTDSGPPPRYALPFCDEIKNLPQSHSCSPLSPLVWIRIISHGNDPDLLLLVSSSVFRKARPRKGGDGARFMDLALASFGCILHGFGDAGFRRDHHARD